MIAPKRWPIRDGDPGLRPVLDALDGVDLLLIGEATHGGAEFCALKARLVRLLARKAGFRHLLMESGFLETTLAGLSRPRPDAGRLARETLFASFRWRETLPALALVAEDPAFGYHGIDPQFGADHLLTIVPGAVRATSPTLADSLANRLGGCYALFGKTGDPDAFREARDAWLVWLRETRAGLAALRPAPADRDRIAVVARGLSVLDRYWNVAPTALHGAERNAVRDAIMAEHAEWILKRGRGRAILWAHNGHIGTVPWTPTAGDLLQRKRGRRAYRLGLLALEGTFHNHVTRRTEAWSAPAAGVERALGDPSATVFVDFRRATAKERAPFLEPMPAFEPENGGAFAFVPATRFDGVIVVPKLSPPTPVEP